MNKVKRCKAVMSAAILVMSISAGHSQSAMERQRAGVSQFETGSNMRELMDVRSQEMKELAQQVPEPQKAAESLISTAAEARAAIARALETPNAARTVNDLLPAVKKGFFESEDRYLQRGKDAARAALAMLFPGTESAEVGARMHKCGMDWPGYDGLRAEAKWEHEGWKYSAEIYACHRNSDPFMVKYVAVTPADGDIGKMPKTNKEFIRLVNNLARFRIETSEGYTDWKGRAGFRSALGGSAFMDISYTGIYSWFPEDVGAVFFQRLNDADLQYLKK